MFKSRAPAAVAVEIVHLIVEIAALSANKFAV